MSHPSLKVNALSNWVSLAVNIAIGFLLTPFIIRSLGKTGYGIWVFVCSLIGYYGLLNLGVGSAITRYIARYSVQKDPKGLGEVASTALAIFSVTAILAIALSFMLAGTIADFFNVGPAERAGFVRLIWIVGLATGVSFPGSVFGAIITAREHYVAKNIVVVLQELLRAGLTVLFVTVGWGLLGVGLAPLIASVFGIICNVLLFRIFAADITLRPSYANKRTLVMLLIYGGATTVISIADLLRINLDSFVIGKWMNMEAVGVYGVAALIVRYMARLISSTMGVLSPRFASLDGRGNKVELQRLFLRSLRISAFFSFGISFSAITFGPRFILVWAGADYSGAVPVLIIISAAYAFALSQNPSIILLYAMNKHHYYAFYTILEAAANVLLSILLVGQYGILGVALGTAIPMLIIKCLVMPVYVSRVSGMSLFRYLKAFYLPLFAISLFFAVFYLFDCKTLLLDCHLGVYFIVFSVFGIAYLVVFLLSYFKWIVKQETI